MRFPLAAVFLIIGAFIFFVFWAVSSLLLSEVAGALRPTAVGDAGYYLGYIPWAFGIIAAIFFTVGVIFIFVLESLSDEPEIYYRR